MGPTASGKTDLAIALCDYLNIEIISVDSTQVYYDLNIGSGKPPKEILGKIPHYLIDKLPPDAVYSAAQFCEDAKRRIDEIQARGNIPCLVGGTMMYFNALQNGLHALPPADPVLRDRILQEAQISGWESLHRQLAEVDPASASRIRPSDKQRLQRALEIYYLTQEPPSKHFQSQRAATPHHCVNIALMPVDTPRAILHEKINRRFEAMLAQGLVDELVQVRGRYLLHAALPSMRSVGYRQVWMYLEGAYDYQQMCERAKAATRQLAKRQLTWLRSWSNLKKIDMSASDRLQQALTMIQES